MAVAGAQEMVSEGLKTAIWRAERSRLFTTIGVTKKAKLPFFDAGQIPKFNFTQCGKCTRISPESRKNALNSGPNG